MLGLVGVDVDGTLVGTDNRVREDVWAAIERGRAAGMHFAICTGRPAVGNALEYARRLDPDGWHVFQNGASIVHARTGESLSAAFPEEALPGLLDMSHERGWLLELYTDTDMAVTQPGDVARRHADLLGIPYRPQPPEALEGTVVRVQWVVPREEEGTVTATPHPGLDLHPAGSPVMRDVMFVSVTRAGVNKGSALGRIAQRYGFGMDRVMMVGDGENDVTALRVVGHPVAMGNADAPAREAARYQVGHVDQGGLIGAVDLALGL